jgi:hypothetical protein
MARIISGVQASDLQELGVFLISKLLKKNSRSDGSDDAWLLDSDDRGTFSISGLPKMLLPRSTAPVDLRSTVHNYFGSLGLGSSGVSRTSHFKLPKLTSPNTWIGCHLSPSRSTTHARSGPWDFRPFSLALYFMRF